MCLRFERIPEEKDDVQSPLCDPRSDLLVAPERPAQEAGDREPKLILDESTRCPGGVQLVSLEGLAVEAHPVEHVELAVVMCDKRYVLAGVQTDLRRRTPGRRRSRRRAEQTLHGRSHRTRTVGTASWSGSVRRAGSFWSSVSWRQPS